ncbi:VIT1/CCC1 transporter family protein [Williamsia sp. CHRR-6]|uniref:VIT1/CCC1 transporter family protein n=1 Tax=Williamsia sp. CHRR-6 TaxID=2835871 RepID=UPI001BD9D470|nr:VIT1/CCC1 transporter family protein [Williamsia sp. CHRR-6]MBT0565584.1 VIT1/CCC1 transporter family protein [Williamsia sp. CHRR-6]
MTSSNSESAQGASPTSDSADLTPIVGAHDDGNGTDEVGHTHADVSGGFLRAATFGAMDGLVTNISLVAGVGGSGASGHTVILSGVASLVAGAFSMALGEYTSVSTQNEQVDAEVRTERRELATNPEAETAELAEMFIDMGLTEKTARTAAEEVHRDPERAVNLHLTQELGLDPNEKPSPMLAAVSSFFMFSLGAVFPLIPYFFGSELLWLALLVGGIGLLGAGALAARFTDKPIWWGAVRQLLFGVIAAGATYLVGYLIGTPTA